MKKIYLVGRVINTLLFFFIISNAWANRSLSGLIKDKSTGESLPGVSVSVKGTSLGAISDAGGAFKLQVSDNAVTLVFTSIGYVSQEVTVPANHSGQLLVELIEDAKNLSELIVVGYGTQTKTEFTGSAVQIKGDAIKEQPVQSFDQALQGRAAGVSISQPNGVLNNPPVIRIRGVNSISLSSYPLIVVDGVPINTGNISADSNVPNNPLGDINPADIESIDILKDAASTAIYGSRAAAGVLLITTKKGKEGRVRVGYEGWIGVSNAVRLPELLNAEQFATIKNESILNSRLLAGTSTEGYQQFFPSQNPDGSNVDTRWYDHIYRTGVSHNHGVNISGETKTTSYFFSANYSDQKGFLVDNDFKRNGIRFNIDHKVNDWLKLRGNFSYNNTYNQSPNSGSLPNNAQLIIGAARMSFILAPNVSPYNADGSWNVTPTGQIGNGNNKIVSSYYNPLALFELSKFTSENDRVIGNLRATFKLAKGLDLSTNYSIDRLKTENIGFNSSKVGSPSTTTGGNVYNISALRDNWNWTTTLNYDTRIGKNHIGALAGYDVQKFSNSGWGASVTQAADSYFEDYQGTWGNITPSGNFINERAYLSYFGRLNYDYSDRYFFTLNYRRDGSSPLGANFKFGDFGGVSAGWLISEEDFFKNSSIHNVLNSAKLKASWGRVGNGNLNNSYGSLELYGASLYGSAPTWALNQAGNPDLAWETSDQTNIGAELGFWNNRIQTEITWFNNDVNGLILSAPQAPSKGIPGDAILANVGSLYNRGLELSINANIIRKSNFSWNAGLNFTSVQNKVTALAEGNADIIGTTHVAANAFNVTRVGHSVGSLYGAVVDGVNPDNGRIVFINKAGDKVQFTHVAGAGDYRWSYLDGTEAPAITAADYQILGNALPKWYGGFNSNFTYYNFDLGLNFTFAGGNYIMNGTRATLLDQRFFNNSTEVLTRWQNPGDVTNVPRLVYNDQLSNGNSGPVSTNVEKGDFLRLQNISLGYRVPASILGKTGINSVRLYTQVSNAFLWTKYSGLDPESSSNSNSNTAPGVELNAIGQARTFTFGLNLGF
jgi:TonB-linked SusC/RagA family outer membrane protein